MAEIIRTPEEMEANTRKLNAEAEKLAAEVAEAKLNLTRAQIRYAEERRRENEKMSTDWEARVYRFNGTVTGASVKECVATLSIWSRLDPGADITIVFNSPGGSIIDGFDLFDKILELRSKGHFITTVGTGMAASMGGVLLQAGDVRVMTVNASLLIHEASFMVGGSFGQIEDEVEFVKMLQGRILDIFAERSHLPREVIADRWERRNWWMLAAEALEHGFVDEVR